MQTDKPQPEAEGRPTYRLRRSYSARELKIRLVFLAVIFAVVVLSGFARM